MNIFGALAYNRFVRLVTTGRRLRPLGRANLAVFEGLRPWAPAAGGSYVVVDLETTGLNPNRDRVVSVGAFRVAEGRVRLGDVFNELVNPGRDIPPESIRVHAILPDMIENARPAWEVFDDFLQFLGKDVLVAHHARFDMFFINRVMREQYGFRLQNLVLDTVLMCRRALLDPDPYGQRKGARRCSLDALAKRFGIYVPERHTALGDALATSLIFQRLLLELEKSGWHTLGDLVKVAGVW
ncbi:MAG: 3'-5' exonuclease [Deltaproteobacteria bacterium]|nr:3'-5' exonuclease [Deltaproteobacteria bacterium]